MTTQRRTAKGRLRSLVSTGAAGALVAGTTVAIVGLAPAASAAEIDADFTYGCITTAGPLDLGNQIVGVNAKVEVPDVVAPGDVISARKTQITLTMPEILRNATVLLLQGETAGGYSENSSVGVTVNGVTESYLITGLAAPQTPIPKEVDAPWIIPTEGDVPEITVPDDATGTADITMPAGFFITATIVKDTGEELPSTLDCTLTTDPAMGSIPIGDPPANTPPTAEDVTAEAAYETPVDVTLAGADADGDELSYTVGDAANGTVAVTDGVATYTPDAGFSGEDSFEYTVSDGEFEATGTVSVTVAGDDTPPANTPPTAKRVTADTKAGKTVKVALDGADADGDDLTYDVETPDNGTVKGDGPVIRYTPAKGFTGKDAFTYTVSDGTDEATAKVVVKVTKTGSKVAKVTVKPNKITPKKRAKVIAVVKSGGAKAKGKVVVKKGKRALGTGTLKKGKVTIKIKKLNKGKHKLTVQYKGNATSKKASKKVTVKVVKK